MQIKINHHYVWAFYLKQWANGNNIFYVTESGKIAYNSVRGLSREDAFYKINSLNSTDIDFIKSWSKESPKYIQNIHSSFLQNFILISRTINTIEDIKIATGDIQVAGRVLKYNSMEDLYSVIENEVLPILRHLCLGDDSILSNSQNMAVLCSHMGHQLTRTKVFKESSITTIKANMPQHQEHISLLEKNWWFLSFILGINVGCSLYNHINKSNNILIKNKTTTPFITSDNPVINIHPYLNNLKTGKSPEHLDIYFPLSPKYAYMINESASYNELSNTINESDVQKLNQLIANRSDKTIYSNSEDVLKSIKNNR